MNCQPEEYKYIRLALFVLSYCTDGISPNFYAFTGLSTRILNSSA